MHSSEIKITKLFCRYCKKLTNQVCINDTGYYLTTACLVCGSIFHFHSSEYAQIEFKVIKIEEESYD
jgi:RNase P subunit RPR2